MIWDQLKNISTWDYGKLIIYSNIVNLNEYKLRETNYKYQLKKSERTILTKLTISAQTLYNYIEMGINSRPPNPREKSELFIENEKNIVLVLTNVDFNMAILNCIDIIRTCKIVKQDWWKFVLFLSDLHTCICTVYKNIH